MTGEHAFSGTSFDAVWASLPESVKNNVRTKAAWEAMTLSAVIHEWWPEIWERVVSDEARLEGSE